MATSVGKHSNSEQIMREGNATVRAGKGTEQGLMALRPGLYPYIGAGTGRDLDISPVPLNTPRSARQLHPSSPSGRERSRFCAWSGFQMCGRTWDAQSPRIWRAPDSSSTSLGTARAVPSSGASPGEVTPITMWTQYKVLFKLFL